MNGFARMKIGQVGNLPLRLVAQISDLRGYSSRCAAFDG